MHNTFNGDYMRITRRQLIMIINEAIGDKLKDTVGKAKSKIGASKKDEKPSEPSAKMISQDAVLNALTMFFGCMEGLRDPSTFDDKTKNVRAFYKLMQDNNLNIDNDDLDSFFDRMIDGPHKLASDYGGAAEDPRYSLDPDSFKILQNMYKLYTKMDAAGFKVDPAFDFAQLKRKTFSDIYNDIKRQDKDYLTIPDMR